MLFREWSKVVFNFYIYLKRLYFYVSFLLDIFQFSFVMNVVEIYSLPCNWWRISEQLNKNLFSPLCGLGNLLTILWYASSLKHFRCTCIFVNMFQMAMKHFNLFSALYNWLSELISLNRVNHLNACNLKNHKKKKNIHVYSVFSLLLLS